jgi:hypothetical protein
VKEAGEVGADPPEPRPGLLIAGQETFQINLSFERVA